MAFQVKFQARILCIIILTIGIIHVKANLEAHPFQVGLATYSENSSLRVWPPARASVTGARGRAVHLQCPAGPALTGAQTSVGSHQQQQQPSVRYEWYHENNNNNNGQKNTNGYYSTAITDDVRRQVNKKDGTLVISKLSGKKAATLEGRYRCVVRNDVGVVVSEPIDVKAAVLSRATVMNLTVIEGDSAVIPCTITSIPKAKIRWEKNGITLNYTHRQILLESGSLLILNTQQSDAGPYVCVATNEIIKKTRFSSPGILDVVSAKHTEPSAPEIVDVADTQVHVSVGANVTLYCVVNGRPKPTVRWEKKFNDTHNIFIRDASILQLTNINEQTAGVYICSARNSKDSVNAEYSINVAPYLTTKPLSVDFPPPQTIRFNCSAQGYPPPTVSWLKDGQPLVLHSRKYISDNRLVLTATQNNDSGFYECVASNIAGEARAVAQAVIVRKQAVLAPPWGVACRPRSETSVCLTWGAPQGYTDLAYTYHYFPADGTDKETLSVIKTTDVLIQNIKPNTTYTFYVRAYQLIPSEPSAYVNCSGVDPGDREITLHPVSPSSLRISWSVLSDDMPCVGLSDYKVQWRRYGHPSNLANSVNGSTHYFQINDLVPKQKYEFRILTTSASPLQQQEDSSVPWTSFTMPDTPHIYSPHTDTNHNISFPPNMIENVLLPPTQIEAMPVSEGVINVTWVGADSVGVKYYVICYMEEDLAEECSGDRLVESQSTNIAIGDLLPLTRYKFRVRAHIAVHTHSVFSQIVECTTLEGVPTSVQKLGYKVVNSTRVRIEWREPTLVNGVLKNYVVKYKGVDGEHWKVVPVRPTQHNLLLPDTIPEESYIVQVFGITEAGNGEISEITVPKSKSTQTPSSPNQLDYIEDDSQFIGILISVTVSLSCVAICIIYFLWRRRCSKLNRRTNNNHRTNGHSHAASSTAVLPLSRGTTAAPSAAVRYTDTVVCDDEVEMCGEVHEMQRLMGEAGVVVLPPNIPPAVTAHLDTKGGATYPNGHINGFKYPMMGNGFVSNTLRITENPQFEPTENGTSNNNTNILTSTIRKHSIDSSDSSNDGITPLDTTRLTNLDLTIEQHPCTNTNTNTTDDRFLETTTPQTDVFLDKTCRTYPLTQQTQQQITNLPVLGPNG